MICQADARRIPLADESVHCCITSPPFWNLRDYGLGNAGIGLEKTVEEYVANIVEVFREVWRVCRPDATVWCNMGDCYNGQGGHSVPEGDGRANRTERQKAKGVNVAGLKPKDLVGIPWRVAFALQQPHLRCRGCGNVAHQTTWGKWPNGRLICPACEKSKGHETETSGWYLRSDIIWHKPNPMPESVRDRPTKAHEYLFLLAKQSRYYYDAEAIGESTAESNTHSKGNKKSPPKSLQHADALAHVKNNASFMEATWGRVTERNRRDVWTISTAPFKGAHFATFPPALVEPCILAGTSAKGVCPECGAPRERVAEVHKGERSDTANPKTTALGRAHSHGHSSHQPGWRALEPDKVHLLGWRPTCDHGGDWRLVATPTGEVEDVDPTMDTGRAGMNRPRGQNEGRRPMYVWAQRAYAGQLQNSPHRLEMEQEAGSAFEHYIRTDESGARPVPPDLLAHWLENGWLTEPHEPPPPPDPVPAVVLDPFCGSGTVGEVCRLHGRRFIGLDLSMKYLRELALPRAEGTQAAGANADLPMFAPKGE